LTSQREAAMDGMPNNSAANNTIRERNEAPMKKHQNAEPQ
jgi:hypothetical protein